MTDSPMEENDTVVDSGLVESTETLPDDRMEESSSNTPSTDIVTPTDEKKSGRRKKNTTSGGISKQSSSGNSRSRSFRAGIDFPVGRVHRYLKKNKIAGRITDGCPVYLAAVVEYLLAEVLELSGEIAKDTGKKRVKPRHILLAIQKDYELDRLFSSTTISNGGVTPFIHKELESKRKRSTTSSSSQPKTVKTSAKGKRK